MLQVGQVILDADEEIKTSQPREITSPNFRIASSLDRVDVALLLENPSGFKLLEAALSWLPQVQGISEAEMLGFLAGVARYKKFYQALTNPPPAENSEPSPEE